MLRIALAALFLLSPFAQAQGLVIHSAELGVGKFHRYDNQKHPYGAENAWTPYVLPADADTQSTLVTDSCV
jgi:hypothetical protein